MRRHLFSTALLALGCVLTAGCGISLGLNAPQRVFPNPPKINTLENVPPVSNPAAEPAVVCSRDLGRWALDGIDFELTAPSGVAMSDSDANGVYEQEPALTSGVDDLIRRGLAGCTRAPAPANDPGQLEHLRLVVERIEFNTFRDGGSSFDVVRVVLRAERFAPDMTGFLSLRTDGIARAEPGRVPRPQLTEIATRRALAELLARDDLWTSPLTRI